MNSLDKVTDSFFKALRPPPKMAMSAFAEKHLRLDETITATPGKLRLYPYQKQMLDAIQEPGIEKVTWLKSSQLGMTTLLDCLTAHYVANDPATLLYSVTRDGDARRAALRIEKLFEASPVLKGLISYTRNDTENRSTLLDRHFPGGNLRFVGVNTPDNLRSVTARILLADEVSGWPDSVEGDPVNLVEMRTASFRDRKLIYCSTPTTESECKITALYEQSDKREWEVKCQHCPDHWHLMFKDLNFKSDDASTTVAICPHCGGVHTDHEHKLAMISAGRWFTTAPHVKGHAGFKINSLSSLLPTAKWPNIVSKFLESRGDDFQMQSFTNTWLGEVWKENFETAADPGSLQAQATEFDRESVSNEVLLVTAGADIQRDRIEITYLGFTPDGGHHVIGHDVFYGDPNATKGNVWIELDKCFRQVFTRDDGKKLKIKAGVVDSGDGVTVDAVYAFTKPRWTKNIFAGKGMAGFDRAPFILSRSGKARKNAHLGIIGTEAIKSMIFGSLKKGDKWHFSNSLDEEWFNQLVSERLEIRKRKGREVKTFVPISGKRQEALDCTVYAIAARHSLTRLNWDTLKANIEAQDNSSSKTNSLEEIAAGFANLK